MIIAGEVAHMMNINPGYQSQNVVQLGQGVPPHYPPGVNMQARPETPTYDNYKHGQVSYK